MILLFQKGIRFKSKLFIVNQPEGTGTVHLSLAMFDRGLLFPISSVARIPKLYTIPC